MAIVPEKIPPRLLTGGHLRACLRSAPEATAMVRSLAGSGGHDNQAPGRTREPELKWAGPAITSCDSRPGVHDSAAAVLSSVEDPRNYVTSRHSLVPLGLTSPNPGRNYVTSRHSLVPLGLTSGHGCRARREGSSRRSLPCAMGASRTHS